ncbi:AAA family ATPase [Micromonospora sp. WMMD736]|uniref:AAA family ATPase n=1 Tax=Micromonospora sp. WMMD736 TaxID=3404112 RepID=UPI003B95A61C
MRIDCLKILDFRNLRDFRIDFDETRFSTVLIGENGTGKSNLLEAIVLIFRDLDLGQLPPFGYEITYRCRGRRVQVEAERGRRQIVKVGDQGVEETLTWSRFEERKEELLPRYVFAYYSGPSGRLRSYFEQHQKRFYDALLKDDTGKAPPIRRLFYCLPEHSRWVLLAYFLRGEEPPDFVKEHFGIDGFDSALLVLKRPSWANNWTAKRPPPKRIAELGDARFWWSRGVVKTFLQRLWDQALAPMYVTEDHQEDYRTRPVQEERLYLYLKDLASLQRLNSAYPDEAAFFAALESTEISNLIRDVRVRVRRRGESIVFSELSEGEQQLLTVIGLMQFTRHEESLFLLDEPDTHLNPMWKLRYLRELTRQVGLPDAADDGALAPQSQPDQSSQLLMTTHDPLTIAGLRAPQVQIFERREISTVAHQPQEDPRGMGVAGVLIHMFGLPTTLDPQTQDKIDERNGLARLVTRTREQEDRLSILAKELSELGLAYEARDPDYRRYLEARHRWEKTRGIPIASLPMEEQERVVDEILDELLGRLS